MADETEDDLQGIFGPANDPDDMFSNFGMLIPLEAYKPIIIEEDPLGAPIYAGCGSQGLCACTGRCKVIIGHTTEPDKLEAYRSWIKKTNELQRTGMQYFYKGEQGWEADSPHFMIVSSRTEKPKDQ